jgi:hypothetical protein
MGSVWMHYFEVVQFACRQQMYMAAAPASELTHWEFALTITMPLAL